MANTVKLTIKDELDAALAGVAVDCKNLADDVSVTGAGNTDASGQITFSDLVTGKEYYFTASKSGYDSIIKAGKYHQRKIIFKHMVADDDHEITTMMSTIRSRTQVQVYEGIGSASGSPQVPIVGATVLVKNLSGGTTIETLTTNADGVALMDDSKYTSVNKIYAVISKTGYNTVTTHVGSSNVGDVISARLQASVSFTTYTLTGRLINADGTPVVSRKIKMKAIGMFSVANATKEHYVNNSQDFYVYSDANGEFEFTLVEGLMVQPIGWAAYFGYPDNAKFTMSANIELGDGTAGKL